MGPSGRPAGKLRGRYVGPGMGRVEQGRAGYEQGMSLVGRVANPPGLTGRLPESDLVSRKSAYRFRETFDNYPNTYVMTTY